MLDRDIKAYFIGSFSTDIGKTHFVTSFIRAAKASKIPIDVVKPVITGFDFSDQLSDSAKIINELGIDFNLSNLDKISPWRFKEPCSPHLLNNSINYQELLDFCKKKIRQSFDQNRLLLIESAGGVMTPINYDYNFLDLASDLDSSIIFVTQNFLGSISLTLTAIEALKIRGCDIRYIIVNDQEHTQNSMMSMYQFASDIERFTKIQTFVIKDFMANLKELA